MRFTLWIIYCTIGVLGAAKAQNPGFFLWRDTFCNNQLVLVNGNFYGPDHPTGTEILANAAFNGADSVVQIEFTFFQQAHLALAQNLCFGDTLWVNGQAYHAHRWLGEEIIFGGAANGCDSLISVHLQVLPEARGLLRDTLCPDEVFTVGTESFSRWRPDGLVRLSGASFQGCDSLVEVRLYFWPQKVDLGPDRAVSLGDTVCLDARVNFQALAFAWMPDIGCEVPNCPGACFQALESGPIVVQATDTHGCAVADTMFLRVAPEIPFYAPNVFAPEADWPNNRYYIGVGAGYTAIRYFSILDRWGNLFYETRAAVPNDPDSGWDGSSGGKSAAPGVYVFYVELISADGALHRKTGSFTLVR